MTYREKYQKDYPTAAASVVHHFHCPKDPNTGMVVDCIPTSGIPACRACWDREMEEVTEDGKETLPR
ncbi:MAG: hypothetical protein PUD70_00705 [Firmicutes bacterium]|nr:hypothetical protein [Bacillota bacterium]